jgi:hypothetical protein
MIRKANHFRNPRIYKHGVPGVISGKFTVRKIAAKSPPIAGHAYIPKKQDVVLSVTSYAKRDVIVLGSKTYRVTPVYRPS